jgi:ABC-type antimicrobial peptide transport system permease subunit
MALGADAASVLRMVVGGGLKVVGFGMLSGLLLAMALARGIANLLYGVEAYDVATLLPATAILTGVAAVACMIPAWRATRVDPARALREQ